MENNLYEARPLFHYKTRKGWVNDPNGLVWFRGYYHVFYQHAPHFEKPWNESMHWGHARTKDFVHFEELPVALRPDMPYDKDGCWSGTAIVKDGVLFLFYACVCGETQAVAVARSEDGVHFEKYAENPVIPTYPPDGSPDFRDPAVLFADGRYWCVLASGNRERHTANLLLYESGDLLHWEYSGILREWENARFAECPSFVKTGGGYLLAASVCYEDGHRFSAAYGDFRDGRFAVETEAEVDKGPDGYAGQAFGAPDGRTLLLTWLPGWAYAGKFDPDVGCMSAPRELTYENGVIRARPAAELRAFIKDGDEALIRTSDGFRIRRTGREDVVYKGEVHSLAVLRDAYVLEVFVNDGETVFSALL